MSRRQELGLVYVIATIVGMAVNNYSLIPTMALIFFLGLYFIE